MKATLGERGQVVIPKPLRDRMGLRAGERLEVTEEPGGRIVMTKALPDEDPVAAVYGIFRLQGGWTTDRVMEELRGPAVVPDDE